ncbi:MAG: hypothetical protein M3O50_09325 [Myxococcota bacterium]|nr:hypothetical protein [Myxococcota bacterium]
MEVCRALALRRVAVFVPLLLSIGTESGAVHADSGTEATRPTTWLPGPARAISRATSASRDTVALEYAYGPRAQASIGAESGLLESRAPDAIWRLGLYAMVGLESAIKRRLFPPSELWRGLVGVSLALELPLVARGYFPPGSTFELGLVVGHESDHFTVPQTQPPPAARGIRYGGGGNFIAADAAVRLHAGPEVTITVRLQDRVYVSSFGLLQSRSASDSIARDLHDGLVNAPGTDVVVRWRATTTAQPQLAVFAEHLFSHRFVGHPSAPDGNFVRAIGGVVFPGAAGELEPFVSVDAGNGKGWLIDQSELRASAGVRYAAF